MSNKSESKLLLEKIRDALGPYELSDLISEFIRFSLKNRYEGFILIDKEEKIAFMDKRSEKFLGLPWGGAKGLYVSELIPDSDLAAVVNTGLAAIGQIVEVKGQKRIINRLPIIRDGEIIGAVGKVIFHNLKEIENLSGKVQALQSEIDKLVNFKKDLVAGYTFDDILGISPELEKVKGLAMKAAFTQENILLRGESGTGKELFAHAIHNLSTRKKGYFVKINCAAIPFELLESELFGYEKGAFTGARSDGRMGKFKLANGGTIFLDEVSALPLSIQPKLLRVLQDKEIQPLGSDRSEKVNFRLIAATNERLEESVKRGTFRSDLYYRLNVIPVAIPPLRDRREDILFLAEKLLNNINSRMNTNVRGFARGVQEIMVKHEWPGNVRELVNVMEQAILRTYPKKLIHVEDLPESFLTTEGGTPATAGTNTLKRVVALSEKELLEKTLSMTKGNKVRAARLLGIHRASLYIKLKKHGIKKL